MELMHYRGHVGDRGRTEYLLAAVLDSEVVTPQKYPGIFFIIILLYIPGKVESTWVFSKNF